MANGTIERSTKRQVKGIPIEKVVEAVVGAITLFSSDRWRCECRRSHQTDWDGTQIGDNEGFWEVEE